MHTPNAPELLWTTDLAEREGEGRERKRERERTEEGRAPSFPLSCVLLFLLYTVQYHVPQTCTVYVHSKKMLGSIKAQCITIPEIALKVIESIRNNVRFLAQNVTMFSRLCLEH